MKLEIKLFAYFRDFLPAQSWKDSCVLEMEEGATIGEVLGKFKIPLSMPIIILVNGVQQGSGDVLRPGDVLSIFPPVAGG